jgi:MinD-like ATPase involved in chromosome partitioning or flagellar assembly
MGRELAANLQGSLVPDVGSLATGAELVWDQAEDAVGSGEGHTRPQILAVAGGHGSPGRSTVALGLATALGAAVPTILVDADDSGPSLAAMLDADPTRNLGMLAHADPQTPGEWDRAIAREVQPIRASCPHGAVLCGLPKPEMRGALAPVLVGRLLDELARRYRYVVLDLGAGLSGADATTQHLSVRRADQVLLVATPDIVGLLHARRALAALQGQCSVPQDRVALVVNRWDPCFHHGRSEIEWALELPVAAIVPHDHRAAQDALAAQRPLVLARRSRAASALLDLAGRLHAGEIVLPAEPEQSGLGGWGWRVAAGLSSAASGPAAAVAGLWNAAGSRARAASQAQLAPPPGAAAAAVALAGPAPGAAAQPAEIGDGLDRAA